jgi:DNA polymerase/3'-5' exonuclease PolX
VGSGSLYPREPIEPWAVALAESFADNGYAVALGGSLARGRPQVRDVDLIIAPTARTTVVSTVPVFRCFGDAARLTEQIDDGGSAKERYRVDLPFGKIKFEIWIVPEESMGTAMLMVRGPANLNDLYRKVAAQQGMTFTLLGLFRDGKNLAAWKDEDQVFDLLGLPRIPTGDRGVFEGMTQYELGLEVGDGEPQAGPT